ncbi:MAG TPA: tripartite tricarboxylate transporter permease [Anaerolineae bacterium]|nr:tripartite tricarboxylate transporter permease [Anaerolineae bacterium]HQI83061.1 tripartite tricarboxylate transporter permease [Anaerolineae bacterium]
MLELILWTLAGTLLASLLALVPALHIYNVAGFILLASGALAAWMSPEQMAFLFLGLITGYAMLNTISSIFLSVPDDSTVFIVLPGQKYLLQRRGYEAVVLTGIGGLGGLVVLALLAPVASRILPPVREILRPHMAWILWTIIAYMLLSEWPKGTDRAPAGWKRWWDGWRSLTAGLATFLLSGLLGFVMMYRSLVPVEVAYQNLLPAFVGLFAVPWVIQNLMARIELPPQHIARTVDAPLGAIFQGTAAGVLGGMFAAFFPVITGGIGGFLAGHATAQRDERAFVISQGASKVVYYVGGFLLFFVPGLHLTRGGMAWMVSTLYSTYTPDRYYWATAAVLAAGVLAFFLSLGLTRLAIALTARVSYRLISLVTLAILLVVVVGMTGLGGLAICAVATGIGLIPVLWGSRRMNAMGVLLLPIALNMAGAGDAVARWLGLL